jgi:Domain of unknown function (DUF397)
MLRRILKGRVAYYLPLVSDTEFILAEIILYMRTNVRSCVFPQTGRSCHGCLTQSRWRASGLQYPETESRVEVYITTDTSQAPHKAGEPKLWVMYDAAKPEAGKLYFTEAEWDAFVLGVKDGEFDLDEDGNLPPVPADQQTHPTHPTQQP